jgi:hypothetical protein
MNYRLAIVNVNDATGTTTIVKDFGPTTVDEYEAFGKRVEEWYMAADHADQCFNALLAFVLNHGISESGKFMEGWSFLSFLDLLQRNIDLLVKYQDGPRKGKYKDEIDPVAKMIIGTIKGIGIPKKTVRINIGKDDLNALLTRIEKPFMDLLMRDFDRRNVLRAYIPDQVMKYEGPTAAN